MAHIIEFEVTGLVGRESVYRQAMNRDVNIFFGANGGGKTSLLKILDSAMTGDATSLIDVPFERARVVLFSIQEKEVTRTIENLPSTKTEQEHLFSDSYVVVHDSTGRVIKRQSKSKQAQWQTKTKSTKTPRPRFAHRYLPISRLYQTPSFARSYDAFGPISEEVLNRYFADSISSLWTSYTSSLLSAVRQAQEEGLASILRDVLGNLQDEGTADTLETTTAFERVKRFLERQGSANALETFPNFQAQYSDNPKLRRVVNDINKIEERIESVMAPRDELEGLIGKMFSTGKTIDFSDQSIQVKTKEQRSISLTSLSSGEKQLMRLLIEVLLADQNSVIIDEPEISMHIDWQRSLVGAMQRLNPHCQLILATHSPEIMAEISDNKIFSL